jgi:hypothetical protein
METDSLNLCTNLPAMSQKEGVCIANSDEKNIQQALTKQWQ